MINLMLFTLLQQGPNMDVGINLAPVNDYNREWVFLDLFKQSREWHLIKDGQVQKDVINNFEFFDFTNGEGVRTLLLINQNGHYPKGTYGVYFKGAGDVKFKGAGIQEISRKPLNGGTYVKLDVQGDNGIIIDVFKAPITNVSVIWPSLYSYYKQTSFHPLFTWDLKRFKYIRFLNWMNTNRVFHPRKWEERTTKQSPRQSYTEDGVAIDYMVELCNETKTNPWFCMPHLYDENYVRQFAQYIKDNLNKDAKIYVEFSNETWNDGFPQHNWAQTQAVSQNIKWPEFIADKAKEVWDVWLDVFNDCPQRIVRVIGGNAASTWPIELMLKRWGDYKPDMVAVAAYFGPTPEQIHNMEPTITAEALLDMSIANIPLRKQFIDNHVRLGLPVGVYEGGQGIVGKDNWLISAYNAQILSKMYDGTYQMLSDAKASGSKTFGVFQYAGDRTDQYGSWGHLEWQDQALLSAEDLKKEAPKMAAVRDFIKK